ncbi:MAG: 16S rRNA (guanine(527)-N(7))-methyltransferase RsmG [Rhodobacterales bacterium]|nr:16S rRNA (guanine(527)-N(7))-methyltransferase RsmG [Rhodobacterales bacterium]
MKIELHNVSRETIERLKVFEQVVKKWTRKINLVSRADRDFIWDRHIRDSMQILDAAPIKFQHWLDLGSGGGFPGIVVAIASVENRNAGKITLVESDKRKAVFLQEALRETGCRATIVNERIENISDQKADVVSARALANLTALIDLAKPHMTAAAVGVFPKGERWQEELGAARKKWSFDCTAHPSRLNPKAAILKIESISHV